MWRLTITQAELKESAINKGEMYESTSEVVFEMDSLFLLLDIIGKFEKVTERNTTYKIEKAVKE